MLEQQGVQLARPQTAKGAEQILKLKFKCNVVCKEMTL